MDWKQTVVLLLCTHAGFRPLFGPVCCTASVGWNSRPPNCICPVLGVVSNWDIQVRFRHWHSLLGAECVRNSCSLFAHYALHFSLCVRFHRYPYYALSVLGMEAKTLTWLRYTAWIPLYPLGFTCEGNILMQVFVPVLSRQENIFCSYCFVAVNSTLQELRRFSVGASKSVQFLLRRRHRHLDCHMLRSFE